MRSICRPIALLLTLAVPLLPRPAAAQPAVPSVSPGGSAATPQNLLPSKERLGEVVTQLLRDLLPPEFESTKKWGLKKRFVRGLDVKLDGLKIRTHRRWKS